MAALTPQVLVVGGGPGGYVAALRAGQLGLDTVLVDGGGLGGTCLQRGCIPSKALIHAAARMVGGDRLGISLAEPPRLDFAATMRWKDGIVARLNRGIAQLLAHAKVRVLSGWAEFSDAKTCIVRGGAEAVTVAAEHVVLAAGSEPAPLPG